MTATGRYGEQTAQRDKPWIFRTYAGHSDAAESNRLYRTNLAKGQTGLSVAFDLPTQTGYDPDHVLARGEVGKVGVPISHLGDMRSLLLAIAVGTQAIVVAAILLVTIMHVGARRRQIGALRALGIPKRSIVAIVWGELFLLFAAGAALGISGGYAAARVISALLTARTAVRLPVEFSAADLPLALGIGLAAALVSLVPALVALRSSPAEALRA